MLAGSEQKSMFVFAGDGYLANVSPSDFTALYEEALPVSISGREWLAEHDEHWDSATQVMQLNGMLLQPLPRCVLQRLQQPQLQHAVAGTGCLKACAMSISSQQREVTSAKHYPAWPSGNRCIPYLLLPDAVWPSHHGRWKPGQPTSYASPQRTPFMRTGEWSFSGSC